MRVLPLLRLHQAVDAWRLDAHEDAREVGRAQELEEPGPLRDGDGHLRRELDRVVVLPAEVREGLEELLGELLVPDQVGVGEAHVPAPEGRDGLDLLQDLGDRLQPGDAAVGDDDVAELTRERATPGRLDEVVEVVTLPDEVEPRDRRQAHVDVADLLVDGLGSPRQEIPAELGPRVLGLAVEHDVERAVLEPLRAERRVRPADDDHLPAPPELPRQLPGPVVLDVPAADRHHVGVGVEVDRLHVLVLELDRELARRHAGHRRQAERRLAAAHPDDVVDSLEAPERPRESRVHEQNLRGLAGCGDHAEPPWDNSVKRAGLSPVVRTTVAPGRAPCQRWYPIGNGRLRPAGGTTSRARRRSLCAPMAAAALRRLADPRPVALTARASPTEATRPGAFRAPSAPLLPVGCCPDSPPLPVAFSA